MDEKEKRTRPTVKQVKALEAEIEELKEQLRLERLSVKHSEGDGEDLMERLREEQKKNDHLHDAIEVLKKTNSDVNIQLLDAKREIIDLEESCKDYHAAWQMMVEENERLMKRSLWQRIING